MDRQDSGQQLYHGNLDKSDPRETAEGLDVRKTPAALVLSASVVQYTPEVRDSSLLVNIPSIC